MSNMRRWAIMATLFVAIVCNYLDRQLLSVLKPEILQHFGIGNLEYAWAALFCAMATFHALAAAILWKMMRPETAHSSEQA